MKERLIFAVVRVGRATLVILGLALLAGACFLVLSGFGYIGLHPSDPTPPTKLPIAHTPVPLSSHTGWQVDRAIRAEISRFPSLTGIEWRPYHDGHELLWNVTVKWNRKDSQREEIQQLADRLVSSIRSVVDQYEAENEGRRFYDYKVRVSTPSGGMSAEAFLPMNQQER